MACDENVDVLKRPSFRERVLWFARLAAAMLCYPRRPRTAGTLWIMLGVLSLTRIVPRDSNSWSGPISGMFMIAMGTWYLVKYRRPDIRAKHVEYLDREGVAEPNVRDEGRHHVGNSDRCGPIVHGRVLESGTASCPPRLLTLPGIDG